MLQKSLNDAEAEKAKSKDTLDSTSSKLSDAQKEVKALTKKLKDSETATTKQTTLSQALLLN